MFQSQSDYSFLRGLPYLMRAEIHKHLDPLSLLELSVMSPEWLEVIRSRISKKKIEIGMKLLTSAPNSAEVVISRVRLLPPGAEDEYKYSIVFETRSDMEEKSKVEIVSHRKLICCYKNFNYNSILDVLHTIHSLFVVKQQDVTINFANGFNVDFLEKLDLTQLRGLYLKGLTPEANVDVSKLKRFLEDLQANFASISSFPSGFLSDVTMNGMFKGFGQLLGAKIIHLEDASWMDGEDLLHVNSVIGEFNQCRLTSEDFNRYFKKLKREEDDGSLTRVEFRMDEGFELDRTKVLKGLGAVKWTPKTRERNFFIRLTNLIDLTHGWDFTSLMGLLTVHFEGNSLKLYRWESNFPITDMKSIWDLQISRFNRIDTRHMSPEERAEYGSPLDPVREYLRLTEEIQKADEYGFSGAPQYLEWSARQRRYSSD